MGSCNEVMGSSRGIQNRSSKGEVRVIESLLYYVIFEAILKIYFSGLAADK